MTVRTRNWAAGIGMGLKSMVGGELKWFTNMVCALSARSLQDITATDFMCPPRCIPLVMKRSLALWTSARSDRVTRLSLCASTSLIWLGSPKFVHTERLPW